MITTRKRHDDLPADLRHAADAGPVVMPGYTLINRELWECLVDHALDEQLFKTAWGRRDNPVTATWEEMKEKHGL